MFHVLKTVRRFKGLSISSYIYFSTRMSCIKKYTLFALWKFTFERKKNARIWMFPFFLVLTQDANIDFHYITLILLKCWIDVEPFSAVHSQNSLNKRLSKFTGGVPFLWCSMKHITFNDAKQRRRQSTSNHIYWTANHVPHNRCYPFSNKPTEMEGN